MSAQWSPSSPAPPPPVRRGGSAFRDTLIVGGIAVVGAVGLLVWGGGDAPAAGQVPGGGSGELSSDGQPASPALTGADGATPAVAAATTVAGAAVAAADAGAAGDYEVDVGMQDSLIGLLPVPAGMTEQPADGTGVRTWTVAGADWQPLRDAYLQVLAGQGYTHELIGPLSAEGAVGEEYRLTHATGVPLELAVGTFNGESVIEVTR